MTDVSVGADPVAWVAALERLITILPWAGGVIAAWFFWNTYWKYRSSKGK